MVAPLLVAAAIGIALWAVFAGLRGGPPAIGRLLAAFALGAIGLTAALAVANASPGLRPLAIGVAALAGLLTWGALARLTLIAPRRRDLIVRAPFALIALILALSRAAPGAIGFFVVVAALAYRWRTGMPTLRLFRLGLGALALVVMLGWGLGRAPAAGDASSLAALATFARWVRGVALVHALFAADALFAAFLRDPTLGIRTVGRRLALSHVLVVTVPLVLLGALWMFTTLLGVASERALVGARALDSEGRQLESALRGALAHPTTSDAALRRLARASVDRWPRLRVWRVRGAQLERLGGDSLGSEGALAAWAAGLDTLRASGVVILDEDGFLGAAVRAPDDPGLAAVALAPVDSVLAREPARIAGSRLSVVQGVASGAGGAVRVGADDAALEHAPAALDSLARGRAARTGSEVLSPADSARLERARRALRRVGLADSAVKLGASRGSGARLTFGEQRFDAAKPHGGGDLPFLLQGHAMVEGLASTPHGWRQQRWLLSADPHPTEVLAGLYHNTRSDPLSTVPLVIVLVLAVSALLVVAFDVVMVTGMGRSITAAIQALKVGARRLESGDLAHRIALKGDDDLWDVADTFNQASAGLERARALEKEAERLESELALARRIQARLLPAGPPAIQGLEIAGLSEPAREVGGDYFDHIPLGDGRVMLVVADVSGKGVGAALLMSGFRASLMSQDSARSTPDVLAGRLNEFLHRSVEPGKFVTAFVAFLDGRDGRLVYANAGHNPPVLLRRDGSHEMLSTGGLILGILPGSVFESGEATLAPGDLVALYTDGVTEGADARGELWGEERLLAALRSRAAEPCADLVRAIVHEVRAYEGQSGPADDITLLVARRV